MSEKKAWPTGQEDKKMEEKIRENNEELENIAGGAGLDEIHNLKNFVYRTVVVPAGSYLQMQCRPNGPFMSTMYSNGESIYVNGFYSEAGYLLAFKNGIYGFVDAKYVR